VWRDIPRDSTAGGVRGVDEYNVDKVPGFINQPRLLKLHDM